MDKKNIYAKKCNSFEELEKASDVHDLSLTPEERLEITQFLREQYYKVKGIKKTKINRKIAKKITLKDLS